LRKWETTIDLRIGCRWSLNQHQPTI